MSLKTSPAEKRRRLHKMASSVIIHLQLICRRPCLNRTTVWCAWCDWAKLGDLRRGTGLHLCVIWKHEGLQSIEYTFEYIVDDVLLEYSFEYVVDVVLEIIIVDNVLLDKVFLASFTSVSSPLSSDYLSNDNNSTYFPARDKNSLVTSDVHKYYKRLYGFTRSMQQYVLLMFFEVLFSLKKHSRKPPVQCRFIIINANFISIITGL